MFYNCPGRKLASHSPPFCEDTHTDTHTHGHRHTDGHAPGDAQAHGPHSPTGPGPLQVGSGRGGGRSRRRLSLPRTSGPHLGGGLVPSPHAVCSGWWPQCLPSAGNTPGPPADPACRAMWPPVLRQVTSRSRSLKAACLSSGSPESLRLKATGVVTLHNLGGGC